MNELETLIVKRAAAMAEKDGVGVQIVHVFGAASQINAEIGSARDRLISHPGQIADVLDAAYAQEATDQDNDGVSAELRRLVIAARVVAYEDQSFEALEELDKASEAFAELVPWDDELQEPAAAEAERLAAEQAAAEAERLAAEQAAADAAEAERLAAEQVAADAAAAAGEAKPAGKAAGKAK
jgi:hypothetical protein